jgi:hypothetical protein
MRTQAEQGDNILRPVFPPSMKIVLHKSTQWCAPCSGTTYLFHPPSRHIYLTGDVSIRSAPKSCLKGSEATCVN